MKQNYESGRSMVEMLGTLAIIGVLSVGAIGGYSYAMDKYRASRTMQEINIRAVDVMAQFDATGNATLDGWKNEKTIYPITLEKDTIGIQVDKVPERVCEMLAEGMERTATAIKINAAYIENNAGDCGDENSLVFYFDEEQAKNEPVKEQCGDIVCEQCQKCDKLTQKCYLVNQLVETLDDMACTTSDGSSGYCSMSDLGVCLEMGGASCPECYLNNNGKCEALDSSMYLQAGYGGYVCTKNGQDGYCINGACVIPEDSTICETGEYDAECMKRLNGVCVPIEGVVECTGEGYTGYCSLGKCYPSCDSCTDDQYCGDSIFTCTDIHSLICRDLDFSGYTIDGTTYYISNTPMTWWDNKDACDVLSKKVGKNLSMITMQELVNNNGYEWSNTLRDEGMGGFDRTELAKKLYEQSHKSYIFTNVAYTHCGGYTVNLFYGIVNAAVQGYGVCR